MNDWEVVGLIVGFLGTLLGAAFFLAQIDKQSAKRGLWMFLICAPMWYFTYHRLNAKYESQTITQVEDGSDAEAERDLH